MFRKSLNGERALVTGASGFIGPHLCRRLAGVSEVHAVSRRGAAPDTSGVRWWQTDLSIPAEARDLLRTVKPEVVFHLAGYAVGRRDVEYVLPTFLSNLATTVNLLTVLEEVRGCRRIVIAGSLEEPDENEAAVVPSSPYAASKWASSAYARMFAKLYGAPVVIARTFMTYGPGHQDLNKLIPHTILSLLKGETPQYSSGRREIDWVYVEDVVNGLIASAEAEGIEGKTLDIGSGELVSIQQLVRALVEQIEPAIRPVFGGMEDRPMEQVRVANADRTLALTGWQADTSLNEGLRKTVEWYRLGMAQGRV